MQKYGVILAIAMVAILLGAAGCQKQTAEENNAASESMEQLNNETAETGDELSGTVLEEGASSTEDVMDESAVQEFTIAARNFSFTPAEISVKKGDKVRVVLNSIDGWHDFVLDEFNARTSQINTGESATVEFVADQTGTFEYYCSVGQHRAMGMVGKLIVSE